jgi:hypothetical protein
MKCVGSLILISIVSSHSECLEVNWYEWFDKNRTKYTQEQHNDLYKRWNNSCDDFKTGIRMYTKDSSSKIDMMYGFSFGRVEENQYMGVDFGVGKLFSNGIDLELNGSFGGKSYKETIPRIMDISFLKMVVVVSLMEDLRLMINVSLLQKIGLIGHLLGLLNFWFLRVVTNIRYILV